MPSSAVAEAPPTGGAPASIGEEAAALARLAVPLIGANLLQMAVYAVDVVFVARLGPTELAAATLGVYLYGVLMFATIGLVSAAAPIIAAELGRRAHAVREVRRSFRMTLWLAVIASVPMIALLANGERVLLALGQDAAIAARAGMFLRILLFAMMPSVASAAMRTTAAALGRPGWALVVTVMAVGLGLLANWCLVFGHAGFPALGLEGSAMASVSVTFAMVAAYAVILCRDRKLKRYRLFGRWWRPEWPRLRQIVVLGLPIAATMTFEGALFSAAGVLMGLIGVAELAANALALQIAAIAFQLPFGLGQAATIRVGMAYGARDPVWIGRAGWVALAACGGIALVTASAIWAAPHLLLSAYIDIEAPRNVRVAALATSYLGIAAAFQLFDGVQAVAAGILRGLQDTRRPMLIAAFGYWAVGFAIAWTLGFRFALGGIGVWWGLAAGLAAVSIALIARWCFRDRFGLMPATSRRPAGI